MTAQHVGRQVGRSEGRIVGIEGKLHAPATTTCTIVDTALQAA